MALLGKESGEGADLGLGAGFDAHVDAVVAQNRGIGDRKTAKGPVVGSLIIGVFDRQLPQLRFVGWDQTQPTCVESPGEVVVFVAKVQGKLIFVWTDLSRIKVEATKGCQGIVLIRASERRAVFLVCRKNPGIDVSRVV